MHVRDFAKKHAGKLAFIAGAGPSLRHFETDGLKDYVVFTANSALLKFPNCDYFVTDDAGVCSWNYWTVTARESHCIKLLYREKMVSHTSHLRPDEVVFFDHVGWASPSPNGLIYHKENVIMTADPEKPIMGSRTSAATAMHLAYIMGCDPIVLIGMDGCYDGRNRYYWQFPNQPKAIEYNNRVFSSPNKGLLRNKPIDFHCEAYDLYWRHFAEMNPELLKGRILYSSDGGIVNIFPSMPINEVFEKFGERKKNG